MYDKELFKANSKLQVEKAFPWAITFNKETISNINELQKEFGTLAKELLYPFIYNKYEILFKLKKSKGDNSAQAKVWGNSVGGHLRCNFCNANFSLIAIISYGYCSTCFEKHLQFIVDKNKNNTASNFGISFFTWISIK